MCDVIHSDFKKAIREAASKLYYDSELHHSEQWQSTDISKNDEFAMWEVLNHSFKVQMPQYVMEAIGDIKPNLPWADGHFLERIGGIPLNPGESYKFWPFYKMDDKMRNEDEKFSHTYMERIWPKQAGEWTPRNPVGTQLLSHKGIRYDYGDLDDVIHLLSQQPGTRQAFLPIWFPEDTGVVHGKRVPCTLGYLFMIRNNQLHITYYIRSCDFLRHFQDDIYLAWKLASFVQGVLEDLPDFTQVVPKLSLGVFTMHIANLHIFKYEKQVIKTKFLKSHGNTL